MVMWMDGWMDGWMGAQVLPATGESPPHQLVNLRYTTLLFLPNPRVSKTLASEECFEFFLLKLQEDKETNDLRKTP